MHNKFAVGFFI